MGQTQSAPVLSSTDVHMKVGDNFKYNVDNVIELWKVISNQDAGERFSPFGIVKDGTRQHLVYEGVVTGIVNNSGEKSYTYHMNKVWATSEPGDLTSKGTWGPWVWEGKPSSYRQTYFGTDDSPPSLLSVTSNSQSLTNYDNFISMLPKYIPIGHPSLNLNSLQQKENLYHFMDKYSKKQLSRVSPTHSNYAEIVSLSQQYGSNDHIKLSMDTIASKYVKQYGNIPVQIVYNTSSGIQKAQTTFSDFVYNGETFMSQITGDKKIRNVVFDPNVSYSSDYGKIQDGLRKYNAQLTQNHGEEALMKHIVFKGDLIKTIDGKFQRPGEIFSTSSSSGIPPTFNHKDNGYMLIQTEVKKLLSQGYKVVAWSQISDKKTGLVKTHFFSRIFPRETRRLSDGESVYAVSGTVRGMDGYTTTGEPIKYASPMSTSVVKSHLTSDLKYNNDLIESQGNDYLNSLAMTVAFERLNPTNTELSSLNIDIAWRLAMAIKALQRATNRSIQTDIGYDNKKDSILKSNLNNDVGEGFANKREYHSFVMDTESPLDEETVPHRQNLLDALEKQDTITLQLASANTEEVTQKMALYVSLAAFAAISLLPSVSL